MNLQEKLQGRPTNPVKSGEKGRGGEYTNLELFSGTTASIFRFIAFSLKLSALARLSFALPGENRAKQACPVHFN